MMTALFVWACLATVWALLATLIIVRNPFPFPDRGHRVFGVPDERARSVVVNIIENLSGKKSKYTFDSGQIHQTILADGFTSIHYIDNRPDGIPGNAISLAVENPLASAQKAIEMFQANGYEADLIEGIEMDLPLNHLIPVKSNAFENWVLVFRRPLLRMPKPKFR